MGMTKKHRILRQLKKIKRRAGVNARKVRRKVRRRSKVALRIFRRVGRRQARRALRRLRRTGGFARRLIRSGPKRLIRRWIKRKARKASGRRTVGLIRNGQLTRRGAAAFPTPVVRRGTGGRHDIVMGRSIILWLPHPELGRGRVLAFMQARVLDVEFEQGGRPPAGVPIEEIRLLA